MSQCNFCKKEFRNAQATRAHLKTCTAYQDAKRKDGRLMPLCPASPRGSTPPPQGPIEPMSPIDFLSILKHHTTPLVATPDDAARRKEKREALIAELCCIYVDCYRPVDDVVTSDMIVAAKVAITDELGALPVEALPQTELALRAQAVRNRVWDPYFLAQKQQLEHKKEQRQQEMLRLQGEAAAQAHRTTHKAVLMEIGVARALKAFRSRGITTDRDLALFEWEVRGRLETLLGGDETGCQAEEAIKAAIEAPLLEWEKRRDQARLAKRQRIVTQCVTLVLPIVEAAAPFLMAMVISKFREKPGTQPSTGPTTPTKETTASSEKPSPPMNSSIPTPDPVHAGPGRSTDFAVERDEHDSPIASIEPEPFEGYRAAS